MGENEAASRDWDWYLSPDRGPIRRIWENVVNGSIPLSELDDQEISQMRLKASDGRFGGPRPIVNRKIASDFRRELMGRMDERAQLAAMRMWEVIEDVATSAENTGAEKLRAATYLLERSIGKIPDKMEITAEVKPWEGTVSGILTDITEDEAREDDDVLPGVHRREIGQSPAHGSDDES